MPDELSYNIQKTLLVVYKGTAAIPPARLYLTKSGNSTLPLKQRSRKTDLYRTFNEGVHKTNRFLDSNKTRHRTDPDQTFFSAFL